MRGSIPPSEADPMMGDVSVSASTIDCNTCYPNSPKVRERAENWLSASVTRL